MQAMLVVERTLASWPTQPGHTVPQCCHCDVVEGSKEGGSPHGANEQQQDGFIHAEAYTFIVEGVNGLNNWE
jgi:hypothetical protein